MTLRELASFLDATGTTIRVWRQPGCWAAELSWVALELPAQRGRLADSGETIEDAIVRVTAHYRLL